MNKPRLVLVDGSSYLYRAFHALPGLSNSKGQPTGAIHGVVAMLKKLQNDYPAQAFAVVFDPRGKTHRDEWYPAYKSNRPPMPDDLAAQIQPLYDIIDALGMPRLVQEGVEADDVIGTLARRAAREGWEVVISTGDKDLAQLVTPAITLVNTMDNTVLDEAGVRAKFGVEPVQIVDYLTLVGDSVDNVPGVPKVGPKTAAKWLTQYGSLEGLLAHVAEVGGAVGQHLREALEQLPLSKRLVTIMDDLELPWTCEGLACRAPDQARLVALFRELEFKTWLRQLEQEGVPAAAPPPATQSTREGYETVFTREHLERWLALLRAAPLFAFDTETTSLDYMEARIVGVSFCVTPGHAAYVPLAHDYLDAPEQLDREEVLAALRPLLEDPRIGKIGHHAKYDRNVLLNHGIELDGIRYDTMLESYVLNSTATRHDLDSLALQYLGLSTIHFEDVAGKGAKQLRFDEVPVELAAPYAAEDADVCLRLHEQLWPRLAAVPRLPAVLTEIEMPLVPVLSRIERRGVLVDVEMLRGQGGELAAKMHEIELAAYEAAGEPFNIGSPKQIQQMLFDKLGLPVTQKTPTGQPSTAESALADLAEEYTLPRLILEHRALSKLKSTYIDRLPEEVNRDTGRVHTSYHQAVAATGRLSSSDPNLQNIPIRTPEGRRIRQAFVAPPGKVLLAADYSQIELRIMAHLSGDARLSSAFAQGADIHRATAAEVFGLPLEQVSDEQRRSAKAINFGLIYGMSAFGLARQLGIERGAAQSYVDLYFARYPGVKDYMDRIRAQAHEQGYVETVFGRRLYLPEINSRNVQRRQYAERTAINAPMQGTAADVIKRAMIAVDAWLETTRLPAAIIMQVHDELVLEVETAAGEEVAAGLRTRMAAAAELAVPLVVETGIGANWDEAH
ncbi:MAG TPA: DNA polymerase I [Gammaproteobacteria bacterium]|nr:DNA polymerase I [Gammaproteobacteria bacterium]